MDVGFNTSGGREGGREGWMEAGFQGQASNVVNLDKLHIIVIHHVEK